MGRRASDYTYMLARLGKFFGEYSMKRGFRVLIIGFFVIFVVGIVLGKFLL